MSHPPIRTSRQIAAPAELVHRLLVDVAAWRLWSPHISWVEPPRGVVAAGWHGEVKAWFAPAATPMHVTWAEPGRGMDWESAGLGHTLRYRQRIEGAGETCRVTFEAVVEGPLGPALTQIARPLSAFGQRRRLARLVALAELQSELQADGAVASPS